MESDTVKELQARLIQLEAEAQHWHQVAIASQKNEQHFRAAAEASMDSLFIYDTVRDEQQRIVDFIILELNSRAETLGRVKRQDVIGKRLLDVFPVVADYGLFEQFVKVVESGQPVESEYGVPSGVTGEMRFFHQQVLPIENGLALMVREITDRKQVALQLQRSEELYRTLLREFPNGAVVLFNLDMQVLLADGAALADMGFAKQAIEGQRLSDIFAPDIFQQHALHYRLALQGHDAAFESTLNGRTYHAQTLPVKNAQGVIFAGMVMFQDITAHKYTEEKLRQTLAENQAIFQALPDPYLRFNQAGHILSIRTNVTTAENLPPDTFIRQSILDMLPQEVSQKLNQMLQRVIANRQSAIEHYVIPLPNQSNSILEFRVAPLLQDQAIAVIRDITDTVEREKQLRRTLEEKDVLLKEVYHRVKNNLQVICSLLSLESKQSRSLPVYAIFEDMRNRVQAMALVHEKLYGAADLNRIDFFEYARELTRSLLYSYQSVLHQVYLEISGDHILLSINQAIPCSLILNELVSNCLKHAFPNGRQGRIDVQLAAVEHHFELRVQDNGVGWPDHFQPAESHSLGLKLMLGLSLQLDGNITFTSGEDGHGCLVIVTFGEIESV